MIVRTDGLVLRTHKMTETSLVVVVFTRSWGKVRLAAKGARRPKSRFGAAFQPLTMGAFVYYRKEGRDLQTASEGDIHYAFDGIKSDYVRLGYGSAVCDLLDHTTAEEDANAFLLSITLDTLRWMETIESERLPLPLWYFQVKSAGCLGYRPHMSGCTVTGERIDGRAWFSPEQGGTVRERTDGPGLWLDPETRGFLEHLQTHTPDRIEADLFDRIDQGQCEQAIRLFLDYHLGDRRPKSFTYLEKLKRSRLGTASIAADTSPTGGMVS
ncbi:TPA: DNA repair protein RecO [Candidatus Latescibacteria bacterium]|nr:DNA repair protein RecO [Candidatus Latescibacterota bacterium]